MNLADVVSTFRAALAALCCARWIYMESTLLYGASGGPDGHEKVTITP